MKERLYEILMEDDVVTSIRDNYEELLTIIPELAFMKGFKHNHPYHHLDVWEHTLYALSFAEKNYDIRLALLLHDIGKPFTCKIGNDYVRHFHGHPEKSFQMTLIILLRLGYDLKYACKISELVRYHDTKITELDMDNDPDLTRMRYSIQYCDSLAHNPNILYKKEEYLDKTKEMIDNYIVKTYHK